VDNSKDIIRVFPRKTKWTPTDDLAFYDEPPLFKVPNLPVYVSCTFTWDRRRAFDLRKAWNKRMPHQVSIGGPAIDDPINFRKQYSPFVRGRFVKQGVTFTSRGCPKHCPWCLVPQREGSIRQLQIVPGHIIQDNNLLACGEGHIRAVFDMLRKQRKGAQFKGGLDIDFLQPWHVDLLKSISVKEMWVACDQDKDLPRLDKAADLLADFNLNKKHCYILMGFDGDTPEKAEKRAEAIYHKGFLPRAQFYRPATTWRRVPKEWRFVQWKWSRVRAYRSKQEEPLGS